MPKVNKYGIKFPFNIISDEKTVLDLNQTKADMVRSDLMHIIFTPKGQRLRSPEFGSRLIQFIFNPNDNDTWGDVVSEIREMVSNWIPDCNVENIDVYETDDGRGLMADLKYSVTESDGSISTYQIVSNI